MTRLVLLICLLAVVVGLTRAKLPVIIWHGMGDRGTGPGILQLADIIRENQPGTYVKCITTSDSVIKDIEDTYLMAVNEQIALVCNQLRNDTKFSDGLHMIGLSQGGLFVRALAQRCNFKRIGSVISIGGPQQGIYGLPSCVYQEGLHLCLLMRKLLSYGAYTHLIQSHLVQAQYWQDPFHRSDYQEYSQFLADINQETSINETYRQRLSKIDALVLVKFLNDTVLVPKESEWFGFYLDKSTQQQYELRSSRLYKEDRLGLKALDQAKRIHQLQVEGDHLQFSIHWFINDIVLKFLNL